MIREGTINGARSRARSIPLFDIDGTLLAGGNVVHRRAFLHALHGVYGIEEPRALETSRHGMIDTQILLDLVVHNGGSEELARARMPAALAALAAYYAAHREEAAYIMLDGIPELLLRLRDAGQPMGLLTGNEESIGLTKMERAGLKDYFSFGAFGSMTFARADLVVLAQTRAREALGQDIGLQQLFIVGDSPRDVACAREAGIAVVAVASGVYSRQQLEQTGADLVLDSLRQQAEFFQFMERQSAGQLTGVDVAT